ncbi:NADH-quinone oxidoreductase subunit L [Euzebya tangerina]|uniref:NADH-quinone oxidoreductase subunit L n=1 Tax=Euzebya tangerina TaxID=591198 RepID=UPI000E3172F8|nr:NADH-quinone oxidoreductase subunit L [Euzebya tangerina]
MISDYAWLIPVIPGVGAVLTWLFGKHLKGKGAEFGITALVFAFLLSCGVAYEVFTANVDVVAEFEESHEEEGHGDEEGGAGEEGEETSLLDNVAIATTGLDGLILAAEADDEVVIPAGLESFVNERSVSLGSLGGDFELEAGQRVDGLAAMMFLLVTFVSLMVHVYSTGYMKGEPRYTYYFTLLGLFTMSMLLMVIANNMLQLLVGWELVGVCSFLLIGFYWEGRKNQSAAQKAFLTTKFGDVGLMVGVVSLWAQFGTFNIGTIIHDATAGVQAGGAELDKGLLTFGLISLFIGAIGKSAQFPLQTWLPDAMAGPTPVSALIHAATMVTAGVFLVARIFPVYSLSTTAKAVIAIIGAITLFSMGFLALVQDDIKRVLAYSTVSQLGYMVAALAFSYTAGIFHLFTHGFFKALLFLGSGSVIHAVHSNDMVNMGGLRRKMPVTFWTWVVGTLALAAVPPLAGFWSKDEALVSALTTGGYTGTVVVTLGAIGGFVTAFYMARATTMTFFGTYRGEGTPHESPPSMKWPLILLAVPAALIGFINLPFDFFHPYGFAAWTMPSLEYFATHPALFDLPLAAGSSLLGVLGLGLGYLMYRTYKAPAEDPFNNLGLVTTVLQRKYFLDDLYSGVIMHTVRDRISPAMYWINDKVIDRVVYLAGASTTATGRGLYKVVDQKGIDGVVNGAGTGANWTGGLIKFAQSGNVQAYAGAMFIGVFLFGVLFAAAA